VPRTEPVLLSEDDGIPPPAIQEQPTGGTEERVAALVERRTAPWKWLAVGVVVVAVAVGGFWWRRSYRQREESEVERQSLLARVDVLLARLERTKSSVPVIDSTLKQAKADLGSLRKSVAGGDLSSEALGTLAKNVAKATERHEPVLTAATFNPDQAAGDGAKAVTVVVAQFKGGAVLSGSGFAVRNRGDTAWIVTNRHLIEDSAGTRPIELAIVFNFTGQAFRASVVAVHDSADLALLVTRIRGGVPTVAGIADPIAGKPVAMLGFPYGLDSLGNWRETGAEATTSIGTVVGLGPEQLEVDGYGTHGSSGSPMFESGGKVVGVVFGGVAGVDRRLVAVPARRIRELLKR
jgi:S1-C subfamily serine protease